MDGPLVRRRPALQAHVPQMAPAGGHQMELPRHIAVPQPPHRLPAGEGGQQPVAGPDLQVVLRRNPEVAHLRGLAHLHVGVPVRGLVQAQPLLDLIDLRLAGADYLRHQSDLANCPYSMPP